MDAMTNQIEAFPLVETWGKINQIYGILLRATEDEHTSIELFKAKWICYFLLYPEPDLDTERAIMEKVMSVEKEKVN